MNGIRTSQAPPRRGSALEVVTFHIHEDHRVRQRLDGPARQLSTSFASAVQLSEEQHRGDEVVVAKPGELRQRARGIDSASSTSSFNAADVSKYQINDRPEDPKACRSWWLWAGGRARAHE